MKKLLKLLLKWLRKTPIKYKLVFVFWEDANSSNTWEDITTIETMLPAICCSIGFQIKKTDDAFVLTSDLTFDEDNKEFVIEEGGNTMVIPTKNILKITEIPLTYKF